MNNDNNKKDNFLLDEIISPIFGHEYKNRVIENKNLVPHSSSAQESSENQELKETKETNYLEKQIEEELEAKNKIAKVKEYQEGCKADTDVLKQYKKEKEVKELQAALPSNYLNFRDSLEKATDDLSVIVDFNTNTEFVDNSISDIIDDIFTEALD